MTEKEFIVECLLIAIEDGNLSNTVKDGVNKAKDIVIQALGETYDLISREEVFKQSHHGNYVLVDDIEKLPTVVVLPHKCNQCQYYMGVHDVQGHAPCSYHNIGGVLWNWYCSQWEKYYEPKKE